MKKIILFFFLSFLFINTSRCQEAKVGIKTGFNLSILNGTVNRDPKYKPGAHIGGYADLPVSEIVHIQPEFFYSSQGAKTSYGIPGAVKTGETTVNLHYFNLPLLVKIYAGDIFNFQFGPQLGILIGAREKGTVSGLEVDENVSENFRTLDFGLTGGVGLDFSENLNIGARWNYGMSDIGKNESLLGEDPSINNRVFHFYVGFSF